MGPHEGRWLEASEVGCFGLVASAFLVVGLVLVLTLACLTLGEEAAGAGDAAGEAATSARGLDTTDAWEMHHAGLPTRSDVLAWHMYGRWGYCEVVNGAREVHIWHELPGGTLVWDSLYGLDPGNRAFKFK